MLYIFLFLILTILILTQSGVSLHYAFYGFSLWYSKMIPSLVPFMILSGMIIRMNISNKFSAILHPVLKRIFKCSSNVSYGIIIGFLCGFPMGAKVTADMLKYKKITFEEARFLLCFNNNIGPVYFCSFVLPLLGIEQPLWYVIGMYGIPLIYGGILRRIMFRDLIPMEQNLSYNVAANFKQAKEKISLFNAMEESVQNAIQSILALCGYMILFNTLNLLPHFFLPQLHKYIAPVMEITGGLSMLGRQAPVYSLCVLSFGGLSCIAQTNSMIKDTGLSLKEYIFHKLVLTGITCCYYAILL